MYPGHYFGNLKSGEYHSSSILLIFLQNEYMTKKMILAAYHYPAPSGLGDTAI